MSLRNRRYEWMDAVIDACAAGRLSKAVASGLLFISKAINWNPQDGREPGLYWGNDSAATSVGLSRSTFYEVTKGGKAAGFLIERNGNLLPSIPQQSENSDTQSENSDTQSENSDTQSENSDTLSVDIFTVDPFSDLSTSSLSTSSPSDYEASAEEIEAAEVEPSKSSEPYESTVNGEGLNNLLHRGQESQEERVLYRPSWRT